MNLDCLSEGPLLALSLKPGPLGPGHDLRLVLDDVRSLHHGTPLQGVSNLSSSPNCHVKVMSLYYHYHQHFEFANIAGGQAGREKGREREGSMLSGKQANEQ
eukprot:scaffold40624_cov29-Prasinocladus_malaysianus.AAC.3